MILHGGIFFTGGFRMKSFKTMHLARYALATGMAGLLFFLLLALWAGMKQDEPPEMHQGC